MTDTRSYRIARIPGDGIGPEVVAVASDLVDRLGLRHGFTTLWHDLDWGSDRYRVDGRMMPSDGINQLAHSDAIFFGAVGALDVPDHITLWGLLIPIRRAFDQYVNLRPARYVPGAHTPLREAEGIDLVIVRENSEGEYSELGGRFGRGSDGEFALQDAVFTRAGVTRIAEYAAQLAEHRSGRVTSVTKSNGLIHSMPFWDEVVAETMARHPGVELRSVLVDAMAAELVSRPQRHDVILASNLFGDILSDLASACTGSLGIAMSGNIDPTRRHPSMFESVHGSAPDIAGKGIADPLAQVGSAAMMLDHLGESAAADELMDSVFTVLAGSVRTPDLGGSATTAEMHEELARVLGL